MKQDANVFWVVLAGLFGLGGARLYLRKRLSAKPPEEPKGESKGGTMPQARTKHVAAYRLPTGELSYSRKDAVVVTPIEVKDKAVMILNRMTQPQLSPGAFVGVAARETSFAVNEEDFDYYADGSLRRHTYGIFQSDKANAAASLSAALDEFAPTFVGYLIKIGKAAGFTLNNVPRDAYAYAAWAHNAGVEEPLTSIKKNGFSWQKTIERNKKAYDAGDNQPEHGAGYMWLKMIPYANKVLEYVDKYPNARLVA